MAPPLRHLFLLLLLGLPLGSRAQSLPDTTFILPDVVVTATRAEAASADVPVRVTVLDAAAVERTGAPTVADLLGAEAGLFVRRYGNQLATLSLRGTGPSQTLVLLDGHRIADPQLGQLDLTLLPTLLLESVEVAHGAGSPLYGSDGIGGVVNLRTRAPGEAVEFKLVGGAGAYGARHGGLLAGFGDAALSGLVLAEYDAADGAFPYLDGTRFPPRTVRRENADHRRRTLYATARWAAGRHRLRAAGWFADAERGLPGLATTPARGERQWDEHLRFWLDDDVALGRGTLRLGGLVQQARLRYVNPQLGLDETGRTRLASAEAELSVLAGRRWALSGGLAAGWAGAAHPSLAGGAAERHASAFASGTGSYGPILLYPALRADAYALADGTRRAALSPRLGLNATLPHGLHAKASAGRAFRMPTLNDRYWQPGGNPGLRPERGWSGDAGLYRQGAHGRAEATAFASLTRNQIVWLPTPAGHYAPDNVGRVRVLGFEASWRRRWTWRPARSLDAALFYTYTDARDRSEPGTAAYDEPLRYVPREQLKATVTLTLGPAALDVHGRYTGRRYVTTDGSQYLDPFATLDAQLRLQRRLPGARVQLAVYVDNLFDADYAVLEGYPMPPRHARLRLLVETQ